MESSVLERVRAELPKVKVPSTYSRVYKDECMYSFASAESEGGIFVSLSTWHGVGSRFLELDHERSGNVIYFNERHRRVPLPDEDMKDASAVPTKMKIGGEEGFQVDMKNHNIEKDISLVLMPDKKEIPLPCSELPELVLRAIAGIEGNNGAGRQDDTATWEEERKESKYAVELEQLPAERKVSPVVEEWKCDFTGVTDNLWLNLSDGTIGSGRQHFDGSGGNGAALQHYHETGDKFPLVVKLGTITPQGADVYSYAADEDDLVLDPLLKKHLAHWGIDMDTMEKTTKTMAELQVDLNIKFEYNAITEGGADLKPVFGPGLVGLTNLGNYCYMSSILQAVWGIPAFAQTYVHGIDAIMRAAPADVAFDFAAQFAKVGHALVTGTTDKVLRAEDCEEREETLAARIQANAVPPRRFKAVMGRHCADYGTSQQQDASYFFMHFLSLLEAEERTPSARLAGSDDRPPASRLFAFSLEQRVQCGVSGAVSYTYEEPTQLSLRIPLEAASNRKEVDEYKSREETRRSLAHTDAEAYIGAEGGAAPIIEATKEDPVIPMVPFDACLSSFAADVILSDYESAAAGAKVQARKTQRFKTFPPYLMVHLQKYYEDNKRVARKMDVLVGMLHSLNLEHLRAKGPQPDERMQPSSSTNGATSAPAPAVPAGPQPSAEIVSQLAAVLPGFSENAFKRAALAVGNSDANSAMNWLLTHSEDSDINDPIATAPGVSRATDVRAGGADAEAVQQIADMGFTEKQARAALKAGGGGAERAVAWLFEQGDSLSAQVDKITAAEEAPAAPQEPKELLDGPGKYELVAIVSHIGTNTACGHYVAHVMKGGHWCIFNDEKVALSERLPIEHGYMYLYRRLDQPWT